MNRIVGSMRGGIRVLVAAGCHVIRLCDAVRGEDERIGIVYIERLMLRLYISSAGPEDAERLNARYYIAPVSPEEMARLCLNPLGEIRGIRGIPMYYARMSDTEIAIYPMPDTCYLLEIEFERPQWAT